jgi:hypothetical protein
MKPQNNIVSSFLPALAFIAASALAASAQNGILQFNSLNYSINESGASARITVTRSSGSAGEVTVGFMTIDSGGGPAVAGQDYQPTSGTLTFGPGVTSQSFEVPIIDDALHEASEFLLVELVNPPTGGASLGARASATLTIADNDACVYTLSPVTQTLDAGGGLAPAISVTATEGCNWTAVEAIDRDWIAIIEAGGTGSGQVVYSVDPNPGSTSRTATLRIAGKTFTVTQLGVPPPDLTPPTVSFTSPAANSRQTNDTLTVTGKASDNVGVTLVEFRLENEAEVTDYFPATGTANWSATFGGLIPGTNTIRVRSYDAGNLTAEVTRSVIFVEVAPLTIVTNGEGSITPLRSGQLLEVGKDCMAQARPARNHFFTHWSGSVESPRNPVSFAMHPGFVLQGNFVLSPFIPVAGSYQGLFSEFENNRLESSGSLTIKLMPLGAFSARMMLGGQRVSFSGRFALDGLATNIVTRAGTNSLTVFLTLDLAGENERITGTVSDGSWTASILAHRAGFNKTGHPAPQAGRYTLIVPGNSADAANQPGGDSFGTVIVDAGGNASFTGMLADGTTVTQKAPLSKGGWWPLYAPLHGGGGSVLSWVIFGESSEASFTGVLAWIKRAQPGARFYPNGFTVLREVSGSSYRPPTNAMDRVLTFTAGRVQFSAGNLAESFGSETVLANNKVTVLGSTKLTLSIAIASGLFNGSVTPPGATRSLPFRGVLHQKQNYGSGFFLGTDQSGWARFGE